MSRFYLFELPETLLDGIEPFKIDPISGVADEGNNNHESSESESDGEFSDSESDAEDSGSAKATNPTAQVPQKFSVGVTQYNEGTDEESMEEWHWRSQAHVTGAPFVYFRNRRLGVIPEGKVLTIYKSWFDSQRIIDSPVEELRGLNPTGQSAILMVGSGHFAGAIIEHRRHHHKTNISNPYANVIVRESKTFHRYTTRRKQGGAQSASDNARGKANSAGSTIRRSNELALQEEIKELLSQWAPQLQACQRIFYRAPGRTNIQLISAYSGAPLAKDDARLVKIPFATGRPTVMECKSAWLQLTQVQVTDAPKPRIAATPPATSKAASPAPKSRASPTPNPPSAEEQLSLKIVEAIKRSKLPVLRDLIEKEASGDWDYMLEPRSRYTAFPTPLLMAAHLDKHTVVSHLLAYGANPLLKTGSGLTLGDVAKPHKKTADALQISRASIGEQKWNWSRAKIGPPLTKEQVLERDMAERLRIREENEREIAQQAQQEKNDRIERLINKHGSGRMAGGLYEASRGLSQDELKQVERERRARAAEARLARLGGGGR